MGLPMRFAQRARAGERLTGALVRMPAEEIVEMLAVAGLDFVLLDGEHGPADVSDLRRHIALAQTRGVETLVRVGQNEPALILRALDAGASGVLVPHVDTAEQARAVVAASHYPPVGERGFATYGRSGDYGLLTAQEHRERQHDGTLVMVMPESPTAAGNAAQIFAVPGVDGFMIGIADLTASTGPDDPPVEQSCATVHRAGRARIRMDIVGSREAAQRARDDGAQLILYNLTAVLMTAFAGLATD